jgi:hypothetical protein
VELSSTYAEIGGKMAKSMAQRIQDSFTEDQHEDILKYLDWCHSAFQDYMVSTRRSVTSLLVLAAVFELVAESRNAKVTIGSFSISSGSVVLDVLPILVAFFFLQVIVDTNKADALSKFQTEAFKLWSERAEENDLDITVLGPTPLYWGITALSLGRKGNTYRSDRVHYFTSWTLIIGIMLAVFGFEAHAYYVLLRPSLNALWVISLLCTFLCLAMSCVAFIAYSMERVLCAIDYA